MQHDRSGRSGHPKRWFGWAPIVVLIAFFALAPGSASAGRLLVTGHDADLHCSGGSQCHYVQTAVNYVRAGAPDPTKPVLVLDRLDLDFVVALDTAFGAGAVPRVVMDPRSAQFAAAPLTTSRYSAILIASDINCGGCDLNEGDSTPDSDAIAARGADIAAFFNAGGGVYANSGATHGDGDPASGTDNYYSFLPLPVGGKTVAPPFCLTPVGASLGLEDPSGCPDATKLRGTNEDINCCATHNSFTEPPAGSALQVAERDLGADGIVSADDAPETIIADGRASGGRIVEPSAVPKLGRTVLAQVIRGKVFVRKPGQRRFVELSEDSLIRVGSLVDTRRGTVRLTSALPQNGATQSGDFSTGIFQVRQSGKRSAKGLTELRLAGGSFRRCGTSTRRSRASGPTARATASKTIRRLRGKADGRYRTRGRNSSATVRGTTWDTIDRCDGTLTKVARGRVAVRDFGLGRTVLVRAGRSYLARAR
ncbi:MAG: hypothetical protein H0T69_14190 [Thermoleophilaceae bacterium]|nr:hypothetical protein [Thermoleophilaceae bacterium]